MNFFNHLFVASALVLAACGGEETTNVSYVDYPDQGLFAEDNMPSCSDANVGQVIVVGKSTEKNAAVKDASAKDSAAKEAESSRQMYFCDGKAWSGIAQGSGAVDTIYRVSGDSVYVKVDKVDSVFAESMDRCVVHVDSLNVHNVVLDCPEFTAKATNVAAHLLNTVEGDSLVDSRDSHKYATVIIGSQKWMAENVVYEAEGSSCYKDSCAKYEREYVLEAALTACPEGTHLPSKAEFVTLYDYVDKHNGNYNVALDLESTYSWDFEGNGMDVFGFNAYNSNGLGYGYYWTSDEIDEEQYYAAYIMRKSSITTAREKTLYASVRCIVD